MTELIEVFAMEASEHAGVFNEVWSAIEELTKLYPDPDEDFEREDGDAS